MLNCDLPEHHLSSQSRRSTEASINSNHSSTDFYTPSLELQDTRDPSPSEPSPTAFDTVHMHSALIAADRSNDYMSTKSHPYLASQDSGLGIRTDEHSFLSHYDPFNPDQADLAHFDDGQNTIRNGRRAELASPFDENFYTPGPGWSLSDGSTLFSNVARTPYSSTPDRYMYPNSIGYGQTQYMTPQSTLNNTPSHYVPTSNGQFKRPIMIRHNSTACVAPQTTLGMEFPGTTGMDASPCQWASQCETPIWNEVGSHHEDTSHMPSAMFDYVGYSSIDHTSQMEELESGTHTPMTGPTRKKPHLRPSLSESCVPRSSSPSRMRAMSMGQHLRPSTEPQYINNMGAPQLPLPPLPPSMLIKTPHIQVQTPMFTTTTPTPMYRKPRSMSNTPQRLRRPSSPPPSDLNPPNTPFLTPVRQDPTFPGDLYTPRYKRRTSTGRWEGWCGYCHPGRWLDLKNSRFWEDKLRNHGICAKTKLKFAEPERVRWVNGDGKVCQVPSQGVDGDAGGESRKREGLCGVCGCWVAMDGMRTKARDRAVGWWMHAYKCHDHDQGVEQSTAATS